MVYYPFIIGAVLYWNEVDTIIIALVVGFLLLAHLVETIGNRILQKLTEIEISLGELSPRNHEENWPI